VDEMTQLTVPVSLQGFVIVPSRQLLETLSVDDNVIVYPWEMMINGGGAEGDVQLEWKDDSSKETNGEVDMRCEMMTMIQVNEG